MGERPPGPPAKAGGFLSGGTVYDGRMKTPKTVLWEFRLHKNGLTIHSGFQSTETEGVRTNLFAMPDREYWEVFRRGEFLEIYRDNRRVMTWTVECPDCKGFPHFTQIPILLDGDNYILEFRYREI